MPELLQIRHSHMAFHHQNESRLKSKISGYICEKKVLNRGFDENEFISQAHCANTFIKLKFR